jgi:hypothetical protein
MVTKKTRALPFIASSEEALSLVRRLQKDFAGKPLAPIDKARLHKELAEIGKERLRGIARRVLIDLVAPPVRPLAEPDKSRPIGKVPASPRGGRRADPGDAGKAAASKVPSKRAAKKPTKRPGSKPSKR